MLTFSYKINIAKAYKSGTGATHQFIFEQARTILRNDGYVSYAEFLDSIEPSSGLTYLQIMIKGSDDNDGLIAAREHYMDPLDHTGLHFFPWGPEKSAGTLCQERFNEAVSQWQSGNFYNAFYNLGWAAHLVQDVCVPHHAWTTYLDWHSEYEDWVNNNKDLYAVNSGGIYSFQSFTDLQYYTPRHYSWTNVSAYDWVDYNAHESIKHFLLVDSYTGTYVHDAANPYIETVHSLPNNLETTWLITTYGTTGMQLHFEKIDVETGFDYIWIYDKYGNLLDVYTGQHGNFWTSWYPVGDTVKIKVTTDYSVQSWGYKIKEVKYYDFSEDLYGATSVLLPRAQRTTAGFVKFFFDKVLTPIYIRSDGSVDPPAAPIQRSKDVYTFTSNIFRPVVVEKDNIIINGNGRTLQATYNVGDGFYLSGRNNVTIHNVTVTGFWSGIFMWDSANITLTSNTLINNSYYGIILTNSSRNILTGNNVTNNGRSAIYLRSSSNNKITRSKLINNGWDGVWLSSCNNNTITGNEIRINNWGVYLWDSLDNIIYHNSIINNAIQVYSYDASNIWDSGYPSGGNYWSHLARADLYNGPGQNITGGDGICDSAYAIDANNTDHYPLVAKWPSHDVAVLDVVLNGTIAKLGNPVSFNVSYINQGDFPETFNISIRANETDAAIKTITNLAPRSPTTLSLTWNTTGYPIGNYVISAYASPVQSETDIGDNTYTDGKLTVVDSTWEVSFIGSDRYPVVAFAVHNGSLYAAANNKLYAYNGSTWNAVNAPTFITSLEPYRDKLIVGGQGMLYCYNETSFDLIFSVSTYIKVLGAYDNRLYAGTMLANPPALYYCNGSVSNPSDWHIDTDFSAILGFSGAFGSIDSFAVYDNLMYVGSGGRLYSFNGVSWNIVTSYDDVSAFLAMKVYNGKLYLATRDQGWRKPLYQGGTGFSGRVIAFDGENWTTVLDHDYWVYSLEVYYDKLYAGTANKILKYNGIDWKTSFNATEGAYCAVAMITYDGKIYAGMGNGYIFVDPEPAKANPETIVVPEFPSTTTLAVFMALAMLAAALTKKNRSKRFS